MKDPTQMTDKELEDEMDEILAKIENNPAFKNIKVPDDLHDRVMNSIREYEDYRKIKRLLNFIFSDDEN